VAVAQFGRAKEAWFRQFLELPNGIPSHDTFGRAVRGHWGVENDLHWSFDVAMREDDCQVRETQARENLAVLRHPVAMSRLKNDSTKLGIKNKRLKAGWDERYLEKLLFERPQAAG